MSIWKFHMFSVFPHMSVFLAAVALSIYLSLFKRRREERRAIQEKRNIHGFAALPIF